VLRMYAIKSREYYNPDESPENKSEYFRLKSELTQPFLITLFQAVIAFKRMAKVLKKRHLRRNTKFNSRKSLLRGIIKKSAEDQQLMRFNQGKSFIQNIPEPELETVLYKATSDGHFLKLQTPNSSPIKLERRFRRDNIIQQAANKVSSHQQTIAGGKYLSAGEKLNSLLDKQNLDIFNATLEKETSNKDKGNEDVNDDIINLISKNFTLSANKNSDSKVALVNKDIAEYMPGTYIYFGATIALQATHGGYMSYHDPTNVKASAHKILQSARFLILNSDDLTDLGVLRFGDAVWLQAGLFDVLGASFIGAPSEAGSSRKIRPALINSRRENMFKAQQYGRWIVLNRDNPIGSIGQQVSHFDKILLEQEWYFLCSTSPTSSSMWRTKADVDELTRTGKGGQDLFNPISECTWKLHLVKLPKDDISNEKERQRDAQIANEQLHISAEKRSNYGGKISKVFNDMMDANVNNDFLRKLLAHKETDDLNLKKLADVYMEKTKSNWDPHWISLDFLKAVYGGNSIVTKMKAEVIKYKSMNLDYAPPTIRVERIKSKLYKLQGKYWDLAGVLLQNTKASNEMPTSLEPYYISDLERKIKAARVLQRCVRRYLSKKFNFRRALLSTEKHITDKIKSSIREKKKLIIEQEKNRRKLTSSKFAVEKEEDPTIPQFYPIDSLGIFDNPNSNAADINKIVNSRRATNMYNHLNYVWENTLGERRLAIYELYAKNAALQGPDGSGYVPLGLEHLQPMVPPNYAKIDTKTLSGESPTRSLRGSNSCSLMPASAISVSPSSIPSSAASVLPTDNPKGISRMSQSTSAIPTQVNLINMTSDNKLATSATVEVLHHTVSNDQLFTHTEGGAQDDSNYHHHHHRHRPERIHRPQSGSAAMKTSSTGSMNIDREAKKKLMRTKERDYGLPKDVFEDTHGNVNLKTGMKFLKAMSKDPDIYNDITFVKKNRAHSAPAKRK
jgi:hypothetical protein